MRLLKACAVSFVLHLLVLVGIPVNPTGGVPQALTTITVRLEPVVADSTPAAENAAVVADSAPVAVADKLQRSAEPQPAARTEPPGPQKPAASPSSGVELPFIRDPTYYTAKQLDVYPQPLTQIQLDYPASAANAKVDGRLSVLLLIDEFGDVNDVSIVEAQPPGYFEEAALAVFRSARFAPAQRQGHAVKSRVTLQVKYLYGDSVGAAR
jgi:protein TonB